MVGQSGGLQAETLDYLSRTGAGVSAAAVSAIDTFVKTGKSAGWWPSLIEVYPFAGPSLTSALVKLKYGSVANQPSLTNINFVAGDYSEGAGFGNPTVNNSKNLSTGFKLSDYSLTNSDFSMGLFALNVSVPDGNPGFIIGDSPASGDCVIQAAKGSYGPASTQLSTSASGVGAWSMSMDGTSYRGVNSGVVSHQSTAVQAASFSSTTDIRLFRRLTSGVNEFFSNCQIGITCFGHLLSAAQQQSLTRAMLTYERSVRTVLGVKTGAWAWFGDSVVRGTGASDVAHQFTRLVSVARAVPELNFGVSSSQLRQNTSANGSRWAEGGFQRYPDLLNSALGIAKVFVMYGTNDYNIDGSSTGTDATVADFQTKMTTMLTDLAAKYGAANVINITPPYNPAGNTTKNNKYVAAAAAASSAVPGTIYVDYYNVMMAQGTPGNFVGDTVSHPNDAGQVLIATTLEGVV